MKKLLSITLSAIIAFSAVLTVSAAVPGNESTDITIAYTNDVHGRNSLDDYNKCIGFPKAKTIKDSVNADLMLDAGDFYHGQAFATVENGESMAEVMSAVGYDAMTLGNHDWNYGADQLLNLQKISGVPILAGNVVKDGNEKFFDTDYITKDVDGVKVGVFGVIDPEVYNATNPVLLDGIRYTDMYSYAQSMVEKLKAMDCKVVVALSHCVDNEKLANSVSGMDVLICGHLHYEINKTVNNTLIVEAGEYLKNIGIVKIDYDKTSDKVTAKEGSLISYADSANYEENAAVKELIANINASQSAILDQKVGTTNNELDGAKYHVRAYETNLGRVVTDTYLSETGADIAIENGGGIRSSINAGDITKRDIINVAPFGNIIVTKNVKGSDIMAALEESIDLGLRNAKAFSGESTDWPANDGSYLQWGGITVKYNSEKTKGSRVESVLVGTAPLENDKMYVVAGNNYVMQDSTYSGIASSEKLREYTTCDDALTKFISAYGVENSVDKVRLTDTSKEPVTPTEPTTEPTTEPITQPLTTTTENTTVLTETTVQNTTAEEETTAASITAEQEGKVATGESGSVVLLLTVLALSSAAAIKLRRKA